MRTRSRSLTLRLVLAASIAAPVGAMLATAAPPGGGIKHLDDGKPAPGGPPPIRITYYDAKWSRVLSDFAKAAGYELVCDQYPSKKFTRMDTSKYSIPDAQKIISVELERIGYRMKVDGNKLIVNTKASTRQTYERRPAPEKKSETASQAQAAGQPEIVRVPPVEKEFAAAEVKFKPRERQMTPTEIAEARRPFVQQTSAQQAAPKPKPAKKKVQPVEMVTSAVRLKNEKALRVARNILDGFKPHTQLIDEGLRGLPAFQVLSADEEGAEEPAPRLTITIDEAHNELLIQAGREDVLSTSKLIQILDVPAKPGVATRAIATSKGARKVAEALQPELDKLARMPRRLQVQVAQNQLPPGQLQPFQPGQVQPGQDPNAPLEAQPGQRPIRGPNAPAQAIMPLQGKGPAINVDDLKGTVDIEALNDLGVLIIKGNKEDVEKVMAIIRQIEELSVGTAPDVEIIYLQNVSAEGLSILLTDIYSRLGQVRNRTTQQTQSVSIIPLARPNAIMVLASKADMDDVRDLARKLDKPSDPTNEYKVFFLKNAIASQVVTRITELYPAATTPTTTAANQNAASVPGLSPRIRVTSDVRTNSIIVQARPRDIEEIASLIKDLDAGRPEAVAQIKIFPLENAVAQELAAVLQEAIQAVINPPQQLQNQGGFGTGVGGVNQGPQELRDAKSTVLQFLQVGEQGDRDLRSGILSDIRILADVRTNSLAVTAPEESMELMAALIKRFDVPSNAIGEMKIFTLANSDATQMVQMLTELFTPTGAGAAVQQGAGGVQVVGAADVSSSLIPLRFSPETRTNSIVAYGGGEALRVVEAILLRLDQGDIRQRDTFVYKLRNAPAQDVADAINAFLTSQRSILTADPGLISPFEQLDREVIVVPEIVTNSLIMAATPRYLKNIQDIIMKLDIAPQQVMIQAILVEVTLDNVDEFGVELGIQDSVLFSRSLITNPLFQNITTQAANGQQVQTQVLISQEGNPGFNFNNTLPLGNNVGVNRENFGGQGLSNFAVGRANADLGFGGFVLSGGNESISVLLRALASRRRVDVLSRPQVRVADNQLAQIQVGSQISRVTSFNTNATTGLNTPVTDLADLGIILQVIPRITPERQVVMEVVATKSGIQPGAGTVLAVNADGSTINAPIIDITTARTTLSVGNGQTVVMGGMITKSEDHTERKVPVLGDIPVLGIPFRYDLHRMRRTELIIFLTPRVISDEFEGEQIKQIEMDRLHFIECEVEEMHGPLRAFPDALNCPPGTNDVYNELNPQPAVDQAKEWGPYVPPTDSLPPAPAPEPALPDRLPPSTPADTDPLPPTGPVEPPGGRRGVLKKFSPRSNAQAKAKGSLNELSKADSRVQVTVRDVPDAAKR